MAFLIKGLLQLTETEYYLNVQSSQTEAVIAQRIVVTNISASPVNVSLSFYNAVNGEVFATGSVLFAKALAANETVEIMDREMQPDDKIAAYASIVDVVALSIDVQGADGRYIPTPP